MIEGKGPKLMARRERRREKGGGEREGEKYERETSEIIISKKYIEH